MIETELLLETKALSLKEKLAVLAGLVQQIQEDLELSEQDERFGWTLLSQHSLARIWDNEEDADFDDAPTRAPALRP